MAAYQQADRFLTAATPLGGDALLLVGLHGSEAVSQLFHFELDMIAENATQVPFDQILGKKVTANVKAPGGGVRHFSGVCNRIAQGGRDAFFTTFRLEIVPEAWFLTRRTQSRIFQQTAVPDVLKKVFAGLSVQYQLKGKYEPRDYCVQYRESDFGFASRLMEEEGIFYFFTHSAGNHTMILADTPDAHPEVPFDPQATYEPLADSSVSEDRVATWEKTQDLRSMKVTLWDHSFELPHKHLEAEKQIQDGVQVGSVSHKLKLGDAERLELYDWPGAYAQRFDGVGPGKEDRPGDVQKIFEDNKRTAQLRMQEEAAAALSIAGTSRLRQLTAGHRFSLKEHFNADGAYVLTAVSHAARMTGNYRSGDFDEPSYENSFVCIPQAVPFRPRRRTPKPVVGAQTAVVVGPKGEELYTDKYGRVKVQFHWDREGKNDEKSSCWVRVAQPIAGKRWGASFWPRIGQEVVVDHLEGDPDRPIIIGSVYNADQMPAYLGKGPDSKHADDNKVTGFKSNTTSGGKGFNELRFDDAKDKQQIFIHAERDMDTRVKHDRMEWVRNNRHEIVGTDDVKDKAGDANEEIWRDENVHIHRHRIEHVEGSVQLLIGAGSASGGGNHDVSIEKNRTESVGGNESITVVGARQEKIGTNQVLQAGQEIHLKAGMKVVIEAGLELTIKAAGGFVKIDATGVTIEGTMVKINCGGAAESAKSASPESPKKAQPAQPKQADDAETGQKSSPS